MEFEWIFFLPEHSGGHTQGGTGQEESAVIRLTVSMPRKGWQKEAGWDPGPRGLGKVVGFPKYFVLTVGQCFLAVQQ